MAMRGSRGAVVICLLGGCSGNAATNTGGLDDGAQLTASLEIPAGSTATIPPGAKIVAAPGVTITVRGVLVAASGQDHARIGVAQPDAEHAWGGIIVASGGRLDAAGLDLVGAAAALTVDAGSLGARYD